MNESIEFHDAEVRAVREEIDQCVVELVNACVHRTVGRPGVDEGECFVQDFDIVLDHGVLKSQLPEMPCELDGGDAVVGDVSYSNLLPSSLKEEKKSFLKLWVMWDTAALEIVGESISVQARGDARYLQRYSGTKKEPNQPPQRNAGSRPSSDDSSASETPSSLGPRG